MRSTSEAVGSSTSGRRQRMGQDACLNVVALGRIAEHPRLKRSRTTRTELSVLSVTSLGTAGAAHELQVQQAAHAASLVVQAKRQRAVQIGDQKHGFGRDMVGVRRDHDFREILCHPENFAHS
jgi:hypothetical protein